MAADSVNNVMTTIAIVNNGTFVKDAEITEAASALDEFIHADFLSAWGADSVVAALAPFQIRLASPSHPVAASDWILGLYVDADRPRALGYHDRTSAGLPVMKVFPSLAEDTGEDWRMDAAHEVLETIVDPGLNRWATLADGRTIAIEVCDPVQAQPIVRRGVMLSDFVLPAYYGFAGSPVHGALDRAGMLKYQGELLPGGYIQIRSGRRIEVVGASRGAERLSRRGSRPWKRRLANQPWLWRGFRRLVRW